MKIPMIGFGICVLLASLGCCMKKITYQHVLFDENASLKILETSQVIEKSSDGKPLEKQILGLPIHLSLANPKYRIDIFTPINAEPVVFFNVVSTAKEPLSLRGAHLKSVKSNYQYSFFVDEAAGAPISLEILETNGNRVGFETLRYKLVNRGYTFCRDSL